MGQFTMEMSATIKQTNKSNLKKKPTKCFRSPCRYLKFTWVQFSICQEAMSNLAAQSTTSQNSNQQWVLGFVILQYSSCSFEIRVLELVLQLSLRKRKKGEKKNNQCVCFLLVSLFNCLSASQGNCQLN